MLSVTKGMVVHNGQEYHCGEVLPDMSEDQANRLVRLGVCQFIPTAVTGSQVSAETETPDSAGTLNLKADPSQTIQAKE